MHGEYDDDDKESGQAHVTMCMLAPMWALCISLIYMYRPRYLHILPTQHKQVI